MGTRVAPTRAVVYLRISLDATGDQLAVARQRVDCHRMADQRGWQVVEEYVDNSISASDKRKIRPGYDRLLADYAAGRFDALVCWDLDRLTRQPRQLEDWIDAAEGRGLRLVTANGEADLTTDGGRMYARIKAAVARAEVERKGARQRAAAAQRAEHGRPPMGPRLTGYTTAGELIETEAKVMAEVFARFAAGDSLYSVAAWLTETGVPTRRGGARWNPSSVRTILTNPRYAGRAVYDGQETGKAGEWKPIVGDDVFAVVQSRLSDPRRRTQQGTDRKHLGSGLYVCGVCGQRVTGFSGDSYRCNTGGCLRRSRSLVDDLVLTLVRERLGMPDLAQVVPSATEGKVRELTTELQRLRERLARVEADYDADLIDGRRYRVATEKARAELAEVEVRLARSAGGGALAGVLAAPDPVAAFDASSLMLRRAVLEALMTVTLHRAPRGRKGLDPSTVAIAWRSAPE